MKKFFIVLFIIILVLAGVAAIFVATFDLNRYKPQLIQQIEASLGNPVKIGGLSLGWNGGVSLEVKQLAVYRDKASMEKPAVYVERAAARVRLSPLLSKRIEIASIYVTGAKLNVIKEADGAIRVHGINPPSASKPAKGKGKPSSGAPPMSLSAFVIGSVKIEDANIGFVDRSSGTKVALRHLDIFLKNVSLGRTVDFQAKLALFSRAQNVHFKGRAHAETLAGPYVLENFELDSDLGSVDLKELEDSIPSTKTGGLTKLAGRLTAGVPHLEIGPKGLGDLNSDFSLKDGKVALESLRSPFENVSMSGTTSKDRITLKNFSALFAQGRITVAGVSKNYMAQAAETSVRLNADKIVLEDLQPPQGQGHPQLRGQFSASFDGDTQGFSWPMISRTLNGRGEVELANGRVVNSNILRTVFDKLSQVPGVAEALNSELPPQYRQNLEMRDTEIGTIRFPVTITDGVLSIPNLKLVVPGGEIYGAGRVGLTGEVDCEVTIVLDSTLSGILIKKVSTMQYVADATGRLPFPVHIRGNVNDLRIEPDMDSILSRVMASRGQELIGNVLSKALNKTQGEQPAAENAAGSSGQEDYQKILGKFFQ